MINLDWCRAGSMVTLPPGARLQSSLRTAASASLWRRSIPLFKPFGLLRFGVRTRSLMMMLVGPKSAPRSSSYTFHAANSPLNLGPWNAFKTSCGVRLPSGDASLRPFLKRLADLLNAIEADGVWPDELLHACVSKSRLAAHVHKINALVGPFWPLARSGCALPVCSVLSHLLLASSPPLWSSGWHGMVDG